MPLTPDDRRHEQLQHLRWRVGFCQTLFEMHRHLPRRDAEWYTKETALLVTLNDISEELRGAERAASVVRPCEEGC